MPVAAATIGTQQHLLRPGEAPALLLGALITVAVAIAGGALAARGVVAAPVQAPDGHAAG